MPSTNMHLEKRIHPRISVNVPVQYQVVENPSNPKSIPQHRKTPRVTKTLDVSLSGVFLLADMALEVGTVLSLEITLPGLPPLSIFGDVVWSTDTGLGLQFRPMKEKDRNILNLFLYQKSRPKRTVQ